MHTGFFRSLHRIPSRYTSHRSFLSANPIGMSERWTFLRGTAEGKPMEAFYEHELDVRGQVALQYWSRREDQAKAPSQLTFFILGNPGLLDYYIPFLNALHALLPHSHAIISTSHIGHTPGLKAPSQPLSLAQQSEAKVELINSLRTYLDTWAIETDVPSPRLCLMGHSVGSWFMCELMKKLSSKIHAGYMLFPTVAWISESWNGRTLWPIFHRPLRPILSIISPLLGPILPWTSFPPTTLTLLRSPETIKHSLGLARSEMESINDPDLDWFESQRLEDASKGLFGVWAAGNLDGWVGREGPIIQGSLGGESSHRVEVVQGIPHAFCLSDEHSRIIARVVAGWITGSSIDIPAPSESIDTIDTAVPM